MTVTVLMSQLRKTEQLRLINTRLKTGPAHMSKYCAVQLGVLVRVTVLSNSTAGAATARCTMLLVNDFTNVIETYINGDACEEIVGLARPFYGTHSGFTSQAAHGFDRQGCALAHTLV